ncbi:alpha/beta-hydrolase [Meredithblackwellia eburnea MCA 4105]
MSNKLDQLEKQAKPLQGPLVPLLNNPFQTSRNLPQLPPRSSHFKQGWNLHTFVIPAAFPRAVKGSALPRSAQPPQPEPVRSGKIDMDKALLDLYGPQVDALQRQYDYQNDQDKKEFGEQEQLWIAVNRYRRNVPTSKQNAVTLVFSHANGFHKEIWEPTMSDLIDDLAKSNGPPVDEIWTWDCINQGDSAILNEYVLGNTFYWGDNGRDLLHLVVSYIASPTSPIHDQSPSTPSPTFLSDPVPLVPLHQLDNARTPAPPPPRPPHQNLVLVGHSLGGGATGYAGTTHPGLFGGLIFVDPVLNPSEKTTSGLAGGALIRKDRWKDRTDAKDGFLKKEFFRAWDSRVLENYVDFGLKEDAKGVTLKGKGKHEAVVFADPMTVGTRRAYERLPRIPPNLPTHFIFADLNQSVLPEDSIAKVVGQVKHSTTVRVSKGKHLLAQEMPQETASEIAAFLKKVYGDGGLKAKL